MTIMTISLTIEEMVLLLLLILTGVIGGYLVMVLKNANDFFVNANQVLTRNEQKIAGLLSNLELLVANAAGFSKGLTRRFGTCGPAAGFLLQTGAESILVASEIAHRLCALIKNLNYVLQTANRLIKK